MKRYLLILLLLIPSVAQAATLYVDIDSIGGTCDDTAGNTRATNLITNPFCSIEKADDEVVAGDTVYVRAGTYSVDLDLDTAGTSWSAPVTWESYPRRTATIVGQTASAAVWLSGEYQIFKGFNVTSDYVVAPPADQGGQGIKILEDHQKVQDCYVYGIKHYSISGFNAPQADVEVSDNHIYQCTGGIYVSGTTWLVDNNEVERMTWWPTQYINDTNYLVFFGSNNVISNNYMHGTIEAEIGFDSANCTALNEPNDCCTGAGAGTCGGHVDCFQTWAGTQDTQNVLFEDNICLDTHQGLLDEYDVQYYDWIFRRNVVAHSTTATTGVGVVIHGNSYMYIYNNTFDDLYSKGVYAYISTGTPDYIMIKNNIFHNLDDYGYVFAAGGTHSAGDYNDAYPADSNPQAGAHDITSDPLLTGAASGNFRPESTSPAIDAGGWLTTITTATGSGASFDVADAGYFWDGNGVTTGDVIRFENGSRRKITDITGNTITVSDSVEWTLGDGVALDFVGTAPDMGAYEYLGNSITGQTYSGTSAQ